VPRRAEKIFYNYIMPELKEQFQQFMDDGFSAQLLSDNARRLVDDLINSIGEAKIDKLNAVRFFCENDALFNLIIDSLQDLPQSGKLNGMFLSNDMNRKYLIPLTLRPPGAEQISQGPAEIDPVTISIMMEVFTRWLDFAKAREKALGGLVEEFGKVDNTGFEQYAGLPAIATEMKENIEMYRELAALLEETIGKVITKPEAKPALKRYFWEKVIVQGVEVINDFCHNDVCVTNRCAKVHNLAIEKTAELLKIIYPEQFIGSIQETTSRIMARYFEIRLPQTEADNFIRRLFSRYAE